MSLVGKSAGGESKLARAQRVRGSAAASILSTMLDGLGTCLIATTVAVALGFCYFVKIQSSRCSTLSGRTDPVAVSSEFVQLLDKRSLINKGIHFLLDIVPLLSHVSALNGHRFISLTWIVVSGSTDNNLMLSGQVSCMYLIRSRGAFRAEPSVSGGTLMNMAKTLGSLRVFTAALLLLLVWLVALPVRLEAQDNGVYNASNTVVPSPAFIDASAFSGDICTKINMALTSGLPTVGAVVDARGIVPSGGGPQNCATNPFINVTIPSTVLLPGTTINICFPWILPDHTRVLGTGRQTILSPVLASKSSPCPNQGAFKPDFSNAMVEMGYYGYLPNTTYAPCPNNNNTGPCTGVSLEHLKVDNSSYPTTTGLDGIYNGNSQDLSYVDDVNIFAIGNHGMVISGASSAASGAANSGPYTQVYYTGANCQATNGGCRPVCVDVETQTRGLHGITCIGDGSVAVSGHAGIYVNASNNSVEDVHLEGFWDGIRIGDTSIVGGDTSTPVGNIVISNVTSSSSMNGLVQNAVHICGSYSQSGSGLGACSDPTRSVSDVSLFQIKDIRDSMDTCGRNDVQDDVTGTVIGYSANYNQNRRIPLGVYILGEETVANGTTGVSPGYSRFSTSPSVANQNQTGCPSFNTSTVPTWGVGTTTPSMTCRTPGALYSNTMGTGGNTFTSVFVCTGGTWKPIA